MGGGKNWAGGGKKSGKRKKKKKKKVKAKKGVYKSSRGGGILSSGGGTLPRFATGPQNERLDQPTVTTDIRCDVNITKFIEASVKFVQFKTPKTS